MDGNQFDRITRALSRPASRRGLLVAAGALVAARGRGASAAPAAQAGPSTCGAAGDVCTMLLGCCSGLTCVTSAINVNYGVCITGGDGGTVASGTGLISPFSDTIEQEIGAIAPTDTTAVTDLEAEREQRIAAKKARKDARRSKRKSRNTTQQTRREGKRDDQKLRKGPRLSFSLRLPDSMDGTEAEVVAVSNESGGSVFISKIHTLLDERTDSSPNHSLAQGDKYFFLSGLPNGTTVEPDENLWTNVYVCSNPNDGFVITAAFSSAAKNKEYFVYCDGSGISEPDDAAARRRKRQKKQREQAKKKSRNKKST